MIHARTTEVAIHRFANGTLEAHKDVVAIEEPLDMYVCTQGESLSDTPFSITMRTPGHDQELIAGLLYSEGVIASKDHIDCIEDHLVTHTSGGIGDAVTAWLKKGIEYNPTLIKRHVITTSSCGFCGRLSMPSSPFPSFPSAEQFDIQSDVLYSLPKTLSEGQVLFKHTGGIHAAALFDRRGLLLNLFEDVGRHNAMDKLVGNALLHQQLPFTDCILCFSGRVSYELLQKAVMTGASIITSIGAPSSFAIEIAKHHNVTLIGFLRSGRFNVYNQHHRIQI